MRPSFLSRLGCELRCGPSRCCSCRVQLAHVALSACMISAPRFAISKTHLMRCSGGLSLLSGADECPTKDDRMAACLTWFLRCGCPMISGTCLEYQKARETVNFLQSSYHRCCAGRHLDFHCIGPECQRTHIRRSRSPPRGSSDEGVGWIDAGAQRLGILPLAPPLRKLKKVSRALPRIHGGVWFQYSWSRRTVLARRRACSLPVRLLDRDLHLRHAGLWATYGYWNQLRCRHVGDADERPPDLDILSCFLICGSYFGASC
ncbi:hypothetical protein B0H21DRAFT_9088 [Amylocystis lapponica]|nr:hypothetical protein B0H21DRAFT_9088 [Amylocystis lapponica]